MGDVMEQASLLLPWPAVIWVCCLGRTRNQQRVVSRMISLE